MLRAAPAPAPHDEPGRLVAGLLLALASAATINLGFLLQHSGLTAGPAGSRRSPVAVLRNRTWLGGQALGWVGFAAQIIAVALAPLSLVQAFAAGGLAISAPLAARLFRHRVSRTQVLAVGLIAVSLAALPLGLDAVHSHLRPGLLACATLMAFAIATPLALSDSAAARAIAAGVLYAVADAAIKAVSVGWNAHGSSSLLSGWTALAVLATFCGFLAFQSALRDGNAVSAISLMTAMTALGALALGVCTFGESLGGTPPVVLVHLLCIAAVLACVPALAATQPPATHAWPSRPDRARTGAAATARTAAIASTAVIARVPAVLGSLLAGIGLLYVLRGVRWFALGPPVHDSLPLLQLAGFDGQPFARVAAAWLAAGFALGLLLITVRPLSRTVAVALVGLLMLVFASDAAFALTHNLTLDAVVRERIPGLGAWLEGLLFAAGSALPGSATRLREMFEREPEPERRPPAPQCA